MEILARETWDNIRGEIRREVEQQIKLMQSSLDEFEDFDVNKCVPVSVMLYQKYHNKDYCMGCHYAEDDYDIIGEFPLSDEQFIDKYIIFSMQNSENRLIETKLIYQIGKYRKEVDIPDEQAEAEWKKVAETKRAQELADLAVKWERRCSTKNHMKYEIKYIDRNLKKTDVYAKEYLQSLQEKKDKMLQDMKALETPELDNYHKLLCETNQYVTDVY